jgi:RNA polymerase sigma factor (sigma-70 family)
MRCRFRRGEKRQQPSVYLGVGYNPRPTTSIQVLGGGGLRTDSRTDVTGETLFLSNLPVINEVVGQVSRRHRLSATEAEDFGSDVHLHFIERDYDRLRRFEGRSSLKTYINVCVQRCFLDYRNKLWGKWRPSMEATRLGPMAIRVERMVARDGWPIDQALESLKTEYGAPLDEELSAFCARLTQRQLSRERVSDEEADQIESPAPLPDANVVRAEGDFLAKRVRAKCARACDSLTAEDLLILRMQSNDVPVADIARALHLNQKRLYRRIDRLHAELRTRLEADGITLEEMRTLFASGVLSGMDSPHHQPEPAGGTGESGTPGAGIERTSWLKRR